MFQDNQNINIWEQALKQKSNEGYSSSQERTLIILGSSNSGKSTLLRTLKTDSTAQVKPTILFEYSYIKKQSLNKQLIHCYQLSNKSQQEIIPSLINKQNFTKTKIILCVDLSKGASILTQIKDWIDIIKKQFEYLVRQKMTLQQKSKEFLNQSQKVLEGHEDLALIKILPIDTIIVGCKYDQLEKQDSQNRKWVSRALRYLAHVNNCHLFFSSSQNSTLISQIRNAFNEVLFSNKRTYYSQKDHLRPIFVSKGQDSIQSLNISSSVNINVFDIIKKQLAALFSGEDENNKKQINQIDLTKYSQTKIDLLIEERKKEILKITKGAKDSMNNRGR